MHMQLFNNFQELSKPCSRYYLHFLAIKKLKRCYLFYNLSYTNDGLTKHLRCFHYIIVQLVQLIDNKITLIFYIRSLKGLHHEFHKFYWMLMKNTIVVLNSFGANNFKSMRKMTSDLR